MCMLNVFTLSKNGVTISFIGVPLLIITSILIAKIIDAIKNKMDKRESQ